MASRIEPGYRPHALRQYRFQRRYWSRRAAYWITVYRFGTPCTKLAAAFILANMGISKPMIEYTEIGDI